MLDSGLRLKFRVQHEQQVREARSVEVERVETVVPLPGI
jgi:hypothetical protein